MPTPDAIHARAAVLPREQSAGYLANHMARLFAALLTESLAPLGLATAQFAILLELWQSNGPTQRELVTRLDLEQATVANTLARMERDDLITRAPHPLDARAQTIHLTEAARRLEKPATQAACNVNALALAPLDEYERQQLLALMRRVIGAQREARSAARAAQRSQEDAPPPTARSKPSSLPRPSTKKPRR